MAIEIVDFPSYNMVIFHSYVSLPEGKGYEKYLNMFITWEKSKKNVSMDWCCWENRNRKPNSVFTIKHI